MSSWTLWHPFSQNHRVDVTASTGTMKPENATMPTTAQMMILGLRTGFLNPASRSLSNAITVLRPARTTRTGYQAGLYSLVDRQFAFVGRRAQFICKQDAETPVISLSAAGDGASSVADESSARGLPIYPIGYTLHDMSCPCRRLGDSRGR